MFCDKLMTCDQLSLISSRRLTGWLCAEVSELRALLIIWVYISRVCEASVPRVLVVEVLPDRAGHPQEVCEVHRVADVQVEVVLEVLKHVHVILYEVILSNAREFECFVIELPGMDQQLSIPVWILLGDVLEYPDSIPEQCWVKFSAEVLNLFVHFLFGVVERWGAVGRI